MNDIKNLFIGFVKPNEQKEQKDFFDVLIRNFCKNSKTKSFGEMFYSVCSELPADTIDYVSTPDFNFQLQFFGFFSLFLHTINSTLSDLEKLWFPLKQYYEYWHKTSTLDLYLEPSFLKTIEQWMLAFVSYPEIYFLFLKSKLLFVKCLEL
jgi:hypothetical protein